MNGIAASLDKILQGRLFSYHDRLCQTVLFFKADSDYGRRVAKRLKLDIKEIERLGNISATTSFIIVNVVILYNPHLVIFYAIIQVIFFEAIFIDNYIDNVVDNFDDTFDATLNDFFNTIVDAIFDSIFADTSGGIDITESVASRNYDCIRLRKMGMYYVLYFI